MDEPYYLQSDSDLYAVPAGGGEISKVASINGTIGGPRPSPDGKWIAFNGTLYGTPERSYDQSDLFVAPADGSGTPRNLTADTTSTSAAASAAISARRAAAAPAAPSGRRRQVDHHRGRRAGFGEPVRIDVATGTVAPVYQGAHTVQAYTATPDATHHRRP